MIMRAANSNVDVRRNNRTSIFNKPKSANEDATEDDLHDDQDDDNEPKPTKLPSLFAEKTISSALSESVRHAMDHARITNFESKQEVVGGGGPCSCHLHAMTSKKLTGKLCKF